MFSITGKIIFENGQWDIVDENGIEAIDWEEEVNPHNTENLSNFTQYSEKQSTDLDMTDPELPERMAQLEKTINAGITSKTSDRKAAINVRTGQDWAKKLNNDPDFDIFEKQTNKTVRKESQFQDEHKAHLIENWHFLYVKPQDE